MSLLSLDHIRHRYDKKSSQNVLNNVSVSIEQNDILALVGESGCGKTTLGKIAVGLVKPSEGVVSFKGSDISGLKGSGYHNYRRGVQLVHQDPYASLNPTQSIYETLSAGLIRHKLCSRRDRRDRVKDFLKTVGLDPTDDFLHRYPHQLSGGQRQRVGVARALVVQPQLIVADEAVSMLDVSMRVSILDLLLQLKEDRGLSYLFITHDFGVVRYFAEGYRIGVLYFGALVEEGSCAELIERPLHPYTYTLLSAVPIPDPRWNRSRTPVVLRNLDDTAMPAQGCPFVQRCPFSDQHCREETPPLRSFDGQHKSACFHPDRIPSNLRSASYAT